MSRRLPGEEAVYFVYIMASKPYGTLYIGITSDLISHVQQHRSGEKPGLTSRYKVHTLVYFEPFGDVMAAIQREKTMKKWKRDWKINLIERENPHWCDLYPGLVGEVPIRTFHGLPEQVRQ
jgi:putative endonuclease